MNEDNLNSLGEDELAARAAEFEQQPLFAALRKLRPSAAEFDLYALGFAAGQQAAKQIETRTDLQTVHQATTVPASPSSNAWSAARAAMWSSLASIAATVLLMMTLISRPASSTESTIAASDTSAGTSAHPGTQQTGSSTIVDEQRSIQPPRPTTQSTESTRSTQSISALSAQVDLLDEWPAELAKRWRDSSAATFDQRWAVDSSTSTEASALPSTEQPQWSNMHQRKEWLTSLARNASPNTSN